MAVNISGISVTGRFSAGSLSGPPPSDEFFQNVSLLLHFAGTDGSTTIIDSSSLNKTVTVGGTPPSQNTISTAQSKFGGSSLLCVTSTNGMASVYQDAFVGDFTIETWVYQTTNSTGFPTIFRPQAGGHWLLRTRSGDNKYEFDFAGGGSFVTNSSVILNAWTHLALVRSNGLIKLYINGVADTATLTSTNPVGSGAPLRIGGNGVGEEFNGYLDEVRLTEGVARYTTNFTVPSAAFPDQ